MRFVSGGVGGGGAGVIAWSVAALPVLVAELEEAGVVDAAGLVAESLGLSRLEAQALGGRSGCPRR